MSDAVAGGQAGVDADASLQELSDLHVYQVGHPVSVGSGRSALIPVLQEALEGERVSLAGPLTDGHPVGGLRIRNSSDIPLDPGTVTVYEADAFVGECAMPRFKPGEKKFLLLAEDPESKVTSKEKERKEPAFLAKAEDNTFKVHYYQIQKRTYTLVNPAQRPRILYINHPTPGTTWEYAGGSVPPVKTDPAGWLFRQELAPGETRELTVEIKAPMMDVYVLTSLGAAEVQYFADHGYIDSATREVLDRIVEMKTRLIREKQDRANLAIEYAELEEQRDNLVDDLKDLDKSEAVKPLVVRYVAKLDRMETRMDELTAEIKAIDQRIREQEAEQEKLGRTIQLQKTLTPVSREEEKR